MSQDNATNMRYIDTSPEAAEKLKEEMKNDEKLRNQNNSRLHEKVRELLLFTENSGKVVNGFRTEQIIKELKEIVAW